MKFRLTFIVFHVNVQLFQYHLLRRLPFSFNFPWKFVKTNWTYLCRSDFGLYSHPPIIMSKLSLVGHCLDHCNFIVNPWKRQCDSSNFILLFQNCLALLVPLVFHSNFKINLCIFTKVLLDFETLLELLIN